MQFPNPIVNQLIIYGTPDNLPDVTIGPGPNIRLYDGSDLRIELTVNGPGGAGPSIYITNGAGDRLEMSLFDTGIPALRYTIGDNSGYAQLDFTEWLTNRDSFRLSTTGEAGDITTLYLREDNSGFGEIVVSQEIVAVDPATNNTSETWHNLTGQNNWVAGTPTPQYRLMPDGTVMLRGHFISGTTTNGTVFSSLPSGYRPPVTKRFITAEANTGLTFRHVQIQTGGNMLVWNATSADIGLDNIRFELGVI